MSALPTPVPTDELGAINAMLLGINEAPVNTLSGTNTTDVAVAKKYLAEVSLEVQSVGWNFNSEQEYPLVPDVDGNITIPSNFIRVDVDKTARGDIDPVVRGSRLYDKKNHTYTFSERVLADVVLVLPFEELPQHARWYVTVKAVRRFQQKIIGSQTLDGFDESDELRAKLTLEEAEGDNADYSIFDTYGVARVLQRGPNGQV